MEILAEMVTSPMAWPLLMETSPMACPRLMETSRFLKQPLLLEPQVKTPTYLLLVTSLMVTSQMEILSLFDSNVLPKENHFPS